MDYSLHFIADSKRFKEAKRIAQHFKSKEEPEVWSKLSKIRIKA